LRLFGLILLAGIVSAAVAELLNYGVTYWAPCQGEGLACTMDGIAGTTTLAFAPVAMIVFGIVMFWRPRALALNLALLGLFVPVAFLFAITLQEIVILRDGWYFYWREVQKLLQIVAAPALVVLVQWLTLRVYIARKAPSSSVESA
jgi:hypothetical protein